MNKIRIKSILTNSENETVNLETIAIYDEINNIIKYEEEDLEVIVKLSKYKLIINRKNEDYDLNFEFKENETITCLHKIKSLGLDMEINVKTIKLEIKEKYIYVQYNLNNNNQDMGTFEYKLMILE